MACYDGDKYGKVQLKNGARDQLVQNPFETLGGLSLKDLTKKDLVTLSRSPFLLYICFLMVTAGLYYALGGRLSEASMPDKLGMVSTVAETVGLLLLRQKIGRQGTVVGISGMTIAMYSMVYILRQVMLLPPASWLALGGWAVEVLQIPSILLVLDILRSVFVTHRRSYQEELDTLKMQHLVPVCVLCALVVCPQFPSGPLFSFFQGIYIYVDMVALLPQVVMMASGDGKVEASIAHFVAATAVREIVDLWFWMVDFDLGPQGYYRGFNYSGWVCLLCQVFSVLLVADFMYYYFKARFAGVSLSDDVALPELVNV